MFPKSFQEAESIYNRATSLEFAADFTSAFHLYLEAADAFLQLSRSNVANSRIQAQSRASAVKALQRAEKIKKASKTPNTRVGLISASVDPFGADHQSYVLRRSSTVNDVRYPPWNEPVPLPSDPGSPYSDPNGQPSIPLSMTTDSAAITWKRPTLDVSVPEGHSSALTPGDIDQNTINDCSVCASVAVCVQHNQRFNSQLLFASLHPGNQPGRYDLKAYLNGDYRRVCDSNQ